MEIAEQGAKSKDFASAAQYASKACLGGSSAGCRLLARHRGELTGALLVDADRALGLACGKKVADACALAADAGVPVRIESPVSPVPLTKN